VNYLDDPAFAEPNEGPLVSESRPQHGRDPSPEQIAARAAAIRKAAPRGLVGAGRVEGKVPVATERVLDAA